jgi:SAM-dependent methyltransferase
MSMDTLPGFFPATMMPDADWWQALWPRPDEVVAKLGLQAGMIAVDLCCGDGLFTAPMAAVARRVVAIDLDPTMLDAARLRLSAAGLSGWELIVADAYAVAELVDEPVDFVLMANTFHGVPDKPRLAAAVRRTLGPGGVFAVVNWHQQPREATPVLGQARGPKLEMRMAPADVAAAVDPAELRPANLVELPPYHYGVVLARSRDV